MSKLYVLCECDENSTTDHSQESVSYGELSGYTHAEQVHRHGFCLCEDGPKVYDDCPTVTKFECQKCGDWSDEDTVCSICENNYCYLCCEEIRNSDD